MSRGERSSEEPTEPITQSERLSRGFSDRYATKSEIGRGGMGRVVEAEDKILGRTVAVKEVLGTDEDSLRRFARETQITARLEHPAIVPVYDAGVSPDGAPYYVMRKVTGRPLDKLVAASTRLDERLALLPHVLAACQAVAHAHERGIIHRDLKPSNILVGARGETTVIDWGLAKATDEPRRAPVGREEARSRGEANKTNESAGDTTEPDAGELLRTRAGAVFGTPGFMPPEQHASSGEVDARADVYALGATLYFLLAAKTPAVPPAPIAGCPAELAAIIDKALAHDLAARYPDAGALAEDVSRFTTGQLVAAHAYTTRERIARFVRRHRALVITVGTALVVLATGAWIAVGRVLSARDEAIEQARIAELARAREAERASDLVISQARLLLTTNPTGAVAMVRSLATTPRWRDVRAIAAGARAAGVPRALPGPARPTTISIAHDGTHATVTGADGSIHVYDLARRTHDTIGTLAGRARAIAIDGKRALAWSGATFTVFDLSTKAAKPLEPRPSPILRVAAHGDLVYFVDEAHAAWRFDLASGAITEIPIPGQVSYVAVSPEGKRVVFGGEHLWLIEAKRPDLVEKIHDGKKFELAWSPSGEHLAAIGEAATYDITIHPEIATGEYRVANLAAVLARGTLYTAGMSGTTIGQHSAGEADLASSLLGLHVTKGEFVVGATPTALRLFDGEHEYRAPLPAAPLGALAASPRSPYILGIAGDRVLLWNIEHVMPRRVDVPSYAQIATVGRDRAWTISNLEEARDIDVHTGEVRKIAKILPLRFASPSSGSFVIARPLASRDVLVIRRDGTTDKIPFECEYAGVFDGTRALLGTEQHEIVLYDVDKRTLQRIAAFDSQIDRVIAREVNPRWIVAALSNGTLSRHDLASGTATTTQLAARSELSAPGIMTSAATRDGLVFVGETTRIRRWMPDGSVADHVTLPGAIHAVHLLDDARVFVVGIDGTGYVVRTDRPEYVRLPALGVHYAWGANNPSVIVTDDRSGGAIVIDVETNAAWKIAHATPASRTPDISGDGTTVVLRDATLDSTAVALWSLDLPSTPAATARWIDDLTNASFDPRTGMIGWPP